MAVVANKDGQGIIANGFVGVPCYIDPIMHNVDYDYSIPFDYGGTDPVFVTNAAAYASEIYCNTVTGELFRSANAGATLWMKM